MNAPFTLSETDRARLLIEATVQDIERMEHGLVGCNTSTDPTGRIGAALESEIEAQRIILKAEAAFLLGVPVERFLRAAGL